jgi:hypothetical protein
LRERREARGQRFLKSDLVCVECEKRARAAEGGGEIAGPFER